MTHRHSPSKPRPPRPGKGTIASVSRWGRALLGCLAFAAPGGAGAETLARSYPAIAGLVRIRSLDVVSAGAQLHALIAGSFAQRGDAVAYVRSRDDGRAWTSPVFLDRAGDPPPLARRGNDARLAVKGRQMVAVWQAQGQTPGTGPLRLAISDDAGEHWRPGANPAVGDSQRNQSYPALAFDAAGALHLVWLDDREQNGDTQGLRYARSLDGGRHWQRERTLDPAVCTCCWNRLAPLPDGAIAVLYRDSDPRDMRLALRRGGRWRDVGAVGAFGWQFPGCPHGGGGLAVAAEGAGAILHSLVWTGRDSAPGLFYLRSDDWGEHWSAPARLAGEDGRDGDIAAASVLHLASVFVRKTPTGSPLYAIQSRDGGRRWSDPIPLTPAETAADHPRILATPTGYRVFWTEARPDGGKVWAIAALSR
ncbi:sialidase family protein [Candidatus Methylocalor cossyra]|uniref:BNR repeat-like domain-containing protein n=1 Tax=Candidatus Methylocalor cossyra TaxID=3108543 RepID=A0ABM9NIS5_9GAMM